MHKKITITRSRTSAAIPWYLETLADSNELPADLKGKLRQLNTQNIYKSNFSYPNELEMIQIVEIYDPEQFATDMTDLIIDGSKGFVSQNEEQYNQSNDITVTGTIEDIT